MPKRIDNTARIRLFYYLTVFVIVQKVTEKALTFYSISYQQYIVVELILLWIVK